MLAEVLFRPPVHPSCLRLHLHSRALASCRPVISLFPFLALSVRQESYLPHLILALGVFFFSHACSVHPIPCLPFALGLALFIPLLSTCVIVVASSHRISRRSKSDWCDKTYQGMLGGQGAGTKATAATTTTHQLQYYHHQRPGTWRRSWGNAGLGPSLFFLLIFLSSIRDPIYISIFISLSLSAHPIHPSHYRPVSQTSTHPTTGQHWTAQQSSNQLSQS